ncbi:porin [Polynucleobacter sp. MWH-Spelu-300-X4]|uniref:porin n=1 Tax=Polynucleobacter sp. MWH-Spelu-300-X4 TaxID=2689109 RepID=UPI001BFDC5D6|nr:porin [Polynucleobacter sp. MWH-Spelu-300-X4]QWD79881.1 porin [Polynucleobacter sp. MWH-Spelu-300-X4]
MKKSLIALAALASVAGVAQAQSSVTLSGNIDLGMHSLKNTFTDGTDTVTRKQTGPNGNGAASWTSSAIGIDVKEDLGSGMRAGYSAAMNLSSFGASADLATQLLGTGRHSYAFVGGNFGELRIGYQYVLEDQISGGIGRASPTGNIAGRIHNYSFAFGETVSAASPAGALTSGAFTRGNMVEYSSPVMGGLQVIGQWGKVTDDLTTTVVAGANAGEADAQLFAIGAKYSAGALNLGMSYQTVDSKAQTIGAASTTTRSDTDRTTWTFGGNYDFKVAKVFASYGTRKNETTGNVPASFANLTTTANELKRDGWDLGATVPVGANVTLTANYGQGSWKYTQGGDTTKFDVDAYQVAATYALSKRTSATVFYGMAKASGDTADVANSEIKNTQYGFGLRHTF